MTELPKRGYTNEDTRRFFAFFERKQRTEVCPLCMEDISARMLARLLRQPIPLLINPFLKKVQSNHILNDD